MYLRALLICALLLASGASIVEGSAAARSVPITGEPVLAEGVGLGGCPTTGCRSPSVPAASSLVGGGPLEPGWNATGVNTYITNWSNEGTIVENPLDPLNLVGSSSGLWAA